MFVLINFTKGNKSVQLSIRHLGEKHHWGYRKESWEKPQVCGKPFDEPRGKVEAETVTEKQKQEAEKHWCETVKMSGTKVWSKSI